MQCPFTFGVEIFEAGHRTTPHSHASAHELFFILAGALYGADTTWHLVMRGDSLQQGRHVAFAHSAICKSNWSKACAVVASASQADLAIPFPGESPLGHAHELATSIELHFRADD